MLNPAYKLTIGNKVVDTTDEPQASTVVDLQVQLDMQTTADSFTLVLGQVGGLDPAADDDATIELGYADDGGLTRVMSGKVVNVEPTLLNNRIAGYNGAALLLNSYTNQTYENKTAGNIVTDLATQAGVDTDSVEDGITFPAYVIDGRRSFYRHMQDLAQNCGFDLYINPDNALVFKRFVSGETVHVFEYRKHIIELEILNTPPAAASVEAWGESPGTGGGKESWAWLTKDFSGSKGSAGSGSPTLLLERPALRTGQAAQTAADATMTVIDRSAVRGRLLSLGRPEIKLGDAIRLLDVPDDDINGVYQVRSVNHRITKIAGFTTTVEFRRI